MVCLDVMVQTMVWGKRPHMGQVVSSHLPFIDNSFISLSHPSTEVNVCLWDLGEYQEQHADFPTFINPDWIKGHLVITMVSIGQNRTKLWATVDLVKVHILHTANNLNYDLHLQ